MDRLVVANWKLNPESAAAARRLFASFRAFRRPKGVDIVICPPFPYLDLASPGRSYRLGAQNSFWEEKGAFTGEVSPAMLKDAKAEYVILGHSERRKWVGESDAMVNRKVRAALAAGLKVILCVGESGLTRRAGLRAAQRFVGHQLDADLEGVRVSAQKLSIAYEPVWAIGTGVPDKPEETVEMARFIRAHAGNVRVLYGGSVNPGNARGFLKYREIGGALVGGASLKPGEFKQIIKVAGE